MKNSFKLGILALAIAVTATACGGADKATTTDTVVKKDSTTVVKKDTTVKVDTAKKDTSKKK